MYRCSCGRIREEGLGGCLSIWKGPVVVGRSWRVFRDPGGLRLVQKDARGYR